jgi:hypothetical protein
VPVLLGACRPGRADEYRLLPRSFLTSGRRAPRSREAPWARRCGCGCRRP